MADVGRPLLFQSPEDLQAKIDEYFEYCDNKTKEMHSDKLGDVIVSDPEPYTMSGLAYWLGTNRQTIINYSEREEYFDTIKRAKAKVEYDVDRRLNHKDTFTPGLIFNAKNNLGWVDETKVEQSGSLDLNINDMLNKVYGNTTTEPDSTT